MAIKNIIEGINPPAEGLLWRRVSFQHHYMIWLTVATWIRFPEGSVKRKLKRLKEMWASQKHQCKGYKSCKEGELTQCRDKYKEPSRCSVWPLFGYNCCQYQKMIWSSVKVCSTPQPQQYQQDTRATVLLNAPGLTSTAAEDALSVARNNEELLRACLWLF